VTAAAPQLDRAAASRGGGPVLVERVQTTLVDLPLHRPHQFRDTTMDAQAVLLVRLTTRDGVVGVGEGVVPGGPWWGGESVETMQVIVDRYLAPLVVGQDLTRLPALRERMDRLVAANPFAKCALETAMWDAWARTLGLPLHALLGGRCRDPHAGHLGDRRRRSRGGGRRSPGQGRLGPAREHQAQDGGA
jgi:muconate cycloisomerase